MHSLSRETEAETAEGKEEGYSMAFFHNHLPGDGSAHSELGPPTSASNQDVPTDVPTGQSSGGTVSVGVPSSS